MSYGAIEDRSSNYFLQNSRLTAIPKKRWRRLTALCSILVISTMVVYLASSSSNLNDSKLRIVAGFNEVFTPMGAVTNVDGNSLTKGRILVNSLGYDPVDQSDYPWDFVAEPYRETSFSVIGAGGDIEFDWRLEYENDAGVVTVIKQQIGPVLKATLTEVGKLHTLTVTSLESSETVTASVVCKYVRRELRSLTDEDRSRFLDALEITHRIRLEEGKEKYGPKFANYESLTSKHLGRMTLDGYSAFHSGPVFLTAHFAFTLELEQSLQSIDNTVALPYWEYTIDSQLYGEDWQDFSPIFDRDWFGEYPLPGATSDHHYWTEGRWAYTPIPTDTEAAEKNAYGRVTDSINADPSNYVGRGRAMCGLATKAMLPGCKEAMGALAAPDLTIFHNRVELAYHGMLHTAVGGYWDCTYSLGELAAQKPELAPILEGIALQANTLWRSAAIRGLTICPIGPCRETDMCACYNPDLDAKSDEDFPYDVAYEMLEKGAALEMMAANPWLKDYVHVEDYDPHHMVPGAPMDFVFRNMDDRDSMDLIRFLARFISHPPKLSSFATPLAATNDPLFGPTHSGWLRLWARRVMEGGLDMTWEDNSGSKGGGGGDDPKGPPGPPIDGGDGVGMAMGPSKDNDPPLLDPGKAAGWLGHGLQDTLPFGGFFGETGDAVHEYTNEELLAFMDPRNVNLPFVHENLEWPHCAWLASEERPTAREHE